MTRSHFLFISRNIIILMVALLAQCSSYKQNIMFKPGEGFISDPIRHEALIAEQSYVIQKNDYLKLDVYSNKGERIIDPDGELLKQAGTNVQATTKTELSYLVNPQGIAKFPMIGEIKLDSLTLRQAEEILQKQYSQFYKDCFVSLTFNNKRVIVLGAVGGQVIPLINQSVTLAEILALSRGLNNDAKAHNIRVLRGEKVFLIDFTTLNGYKAGNIVVEPGDIIYVEPIRKPFVEGFRDYAGMVSLIVSMTSLIIILNQNLK